MSSAVQSVHRNNCVFTETAVIPLKLQYDIPTGYSLCVLNLFVQPTVYTRYLHTLQWSPTQDVCQAPVQNEDICIAMGFAI